MLLDNSSEENYSNECIINYNFPPNDLKFNKPHKFSDDGKFLYGFNEYHTFKKLCLQSKTCLLEMEFPGVQGLQELVIQGK